MRTLVISAIVMLHINGSFVSGQTLSPQVLGVHGSNYSQKLAYTIGQIISGKAAGTNTILTQGFHQHTVVLNPDSLPYYNIGEIPFQTVNEGVSLAFYVWSRLLGIKATLSIKTKIPQPVGKVEFSPLSGKFSFTPGRGRTRDTIYFMAILNQDTIQQEVYFDIIPKLTDEQTAFGLQPAGVIPDPADDEFVVRYEGARDNTGTYSSIGYAGKTLIFDEHLPNQLGNQFFLSDPVKARELFLYAETIILRSEVKLPGTQVFIFTRNLIIENSAAGINTKPEGFRDGDGPGQAGRNAGNLELHVQNFTSPPGLFFRLFGGDGQNSIHNTGGNGGSGGVFSATLNLAYYADLDGGYSGAGSQDPPKPSGLKGTLGSFRARNNIYSWLHPNALRMVLNHAKTAYLNGHFDFTKTICSEYEELISAYKLSAEWSLLSDTERNELEQLQNEMSTILHRIISNLDYFGNPAGWVPMLSFEVNKAVFEQEIDRSMDLLYYSYWVQRALEKNEKRVEVLQITKGGIKDQLIEFQEQYENSVTILPQIQSELNTIVSEDSLLVIELDQLEKELAERAKYIVEERHKCGWLCKIRKVGRAVGSLMTVIPVYQPALGAIGQGISTLSEIDFSDPIGAIGTLAKAGTSIASADFSKSTADFKSTMEKLDFKKLTADTSGIKAYANYFKDLKKVAEPIYKGVQQFRMNVGDTKAPFEEIQNEYEKMKAESPEYNELIQKAQNNTMRKGQMEQKLAYNLQNITNMIDNIQNGLLTLDGLSVQEFDLSSKQSLRAKIYAKDIELRAKERLLKYHYYVAKAFEYRLLLPYPNALNLDFTFEEVRKVVSVEKDLESDEYKRLRGSYDDVLAKITEVILNEYNKNAPVIQTPLRFYLTKTDLDNLNSGIGVNLNMVERGYFQPYEENIRIIGFKVISAKVHFENGEPGSFAFFDLVMEHSGLSKFKKNGQTYLFNHYNNENKNPIVWSVRYDAEDELIFPKEPSPSAVSLLRSLLENKGLFSEPNQVIYSRPAAWADIFITKHDNTSNGVKMILDTLRLEVLYDFDQRSTRLVNIDVVTNNNMRPLYNLSSGDNNGRKDGFGYFTRTYFQSSTQRLNVVAPADYGNWKFEKWTDEKGISLGARAELSVSLARDQMLKAKYILIQPVLESPDTVYVLGQAGSSSITISNIGTGEMPWSVSGSNDWLKIKGDTTGLNTSAFTVEFNSNPLATERKTHLYVIAGNSIDYLDTITVIQRVITTAIQELQEGDLIKVYPNPSQGDLVVELDRSIQKGQLFIYSITGGQVFQERLENLVNRVNVTQLGKGLYFLVIHTKKGTFSKKISLQ